MTKREVLDALKKRYQELRARIRNRLPVKRKHHESLKALVGIEFYRINARLNAISDHLLSLPAHAASVPVAVKLPIAVTSATEICLFASFAPERKLRPHVREHIFKLTAEGVAVVLIVNTDHGVDEITIEPNVAACLSGCLIRSNHGFDFAAWAHGYSLTNIPEKCDRLYLINDSIVGPLEPKPYSQMMERVRQSNADLIGLTENPLPQPHVQSYFLVINRRLLRSSEFNALMRGIVTLPTKEDVVDQYETQITRFLRAKGYECAALFSRLPRNERLDDDSLQSDDTMSRWAALIEAGFPFIKLRALKASGNSDDVVRLVPEQFRKTLL